MMINLSKHGGFCLFHPMNLFIYYILYLHQYQYQFYMLGYNPIPLYFLSQIVQICPLGVLPIGSCVPLTYTHPCVGCCSCFFLSTSLYSGTTRCFRLILYTSCPRPTTSNFSKKPGFPLLDQGIRDKEVSARCAHCYWDDLLRHLFSWQRKKIYVGILTHVYTPLYRYFCMQHLDLY